ncbi:MAG: cell division protein ZipA [Coriobacteriia bacterium]
MLTNELQISLLAIGAVLIVGVLAFNRWQERKLKRRTEQLFRGDHDDVLLDETSHPEERREERIEPVLSNTADVDLPDEETFVPASMEEGEISVSQQPRAAAEIAASDLLAGDLDYTVRLRAGIPVTAGNLWPALNPASPSGKPLRWLGLNVGSGEWGFLDQFEEGAEYAEVAGTLQLVNRQGALMERDLDQFCETAQNLAADLAMVVDCPDKPAALKRAMALDSLCAEVDILIGLNVISGNGNPIPATKVRALAEAAGMKLSSDGAFYFRNEDGDILFSLLNLDPTPFSPENIKYLTTSGVTLLLEVPKVSNGLRVFDQQLALARQMSASLDGVVVDDNRKPFTDGGADSTRSQLKEIYLKMEQAGLPAGSARAARLFS